MALDLLFDLLLDPLFKFVGLLLGLLVKLFEGIGRAMKLKRTAPGEHHTLTDYADAFLFPKEEELADSSNPPSILDARR
ncbi:MAG: hypothetical protein DMG79_21170 [Acidobacteria bacterium]|nr:MAG: hypothetical protein DMG79_21170 [Acidobacteriota bacterium]